MKTATCIDPQTGRRSDKPEYPVVAVRELILNALEVIDVTENRYSGIPTVYSAMKNAGLPEPKFENERGIFRATLYNSAEIPASVSVAEFIMSAGTLIFFQKCVVELSHGILLILRFICIYYSLLYADCQRYFCPITHYYNYNGRFVFFVTYCSNLLIFWSKYGIINLS